MNKTMSLFKLASLAASILMLLSCGSGSDGGGVKTISPVSASVHTISGTVSGANSAGVTITVEGAATATTTTSADGTYTFSGLYDGNYTVTPSLTGYTFNPLSTSATVSGTDVTMNFTSAVNPAPTYTITGTVSGAVAAGVTITLSGAATATTFTRADGTYTITGLNDGNYTVTPSMTGYTFSPTGASVTISGADSTNRNFTATTVPTYTISGTVSGAVAGGVTINVTGAATRSVTTNTGGTYSISGLGKGSYTLTPSLAGYTFTPVSLNVTVRSANITGRNFTSASSTAPTYTLSGTVSGAISSGVTIFVTGAATSTTTTGTGGTYTIAGLYNGNYTITPSSAGYTFNPTNTSANISGGSVSNQNFTAAVNTASKASIRLDTTRYGSDTAKLSSSPDPAVGVLATGWIKSTHTPGTYPLSIVNQDFWTIRGSNWMIQTVPAATTSSASNAGYTNNIMLFGSAGSSTDIWADDYLLHYDYTVNESTALGWVFCAWHIIVNGSANIAITQKYRYYNSNTFMTDSTSIPIASVRSLLNSRSGTSNFNSWTPSNSSLSFSLGNGLSVPFDLIRVRIYQTSTMPDDAALLALSNNDAADTTAWADYAFNWENGAAVLSDRSGNGRNLSTSGTLYQGRSFD